MTLPKIDDFVVSQLNFIGEDITREGLKKTPQRYKAFLKEFFKGYNFPIADLFKSTFEKPAGYDDMIILNDIALKSFCEHHMLPIIGKVDIAYIPHNKILGISKLIRIVEALASKLQLQERLTIEIADTIAYYLKTLGVAVHIKAEHFCMSMRGVKTEGAIMKTLHFNGAFKESKELKENFLKTVN